jgi:hypothetical protein
VKKDLARDRGSRREEFFSQAADEVSNILTTTMQSSMRARVLERDGARTAQLLLGGLAIFTSMAATLRLLLLTSAYARTVLYWDNWGYYWKIWDARFSWWDLWAQQLGPHRSGIGLVVSRLFLPVLRADMRREAFLAVALILLAGILALGLKRRCTGKLGWTDVLLFLPFTSPQLWQVFAETVNTSHGAFPLVMAMVGAWALLIQRDWMRFGLALVLTWLAVFTGFGFFLGVISVAMLLRDTVVAIAQRKWLVAALAGGTLALAGLAFFVFFHNWEPKTGSGPIHVLSDWRRYPLFVALAYAKMIGISGTGGWVVAAGAVVAAAGLLLCAAPFKRGIVREATVPACLILFSLLFACAMAFGRAELDPAAAQSSRYLPLMLPGLTGLYITAAQCRRETLRLAAMLLFGIVAFLLSLSSTADQEAMQRISAGKLRWTEAYLTTRSVEAANQASSFRVSPASVAYRMQRKLDAMAEKRLGICGGLPDTKGLMATTRQTPEP